MPVVAFETTGIPADATTGIIVVVKPGVSVSAQVSGSVTVLGTALASIVPGVSVTVVTQLGTQIVSVVPGVSVTIQSALSTIVTILSTVNVAIVAGAGGGGSVTTAVPSVSATGQVMWIAGGQSSTAFPVVVTGTVTAGAGTTIVSIQNVVGVTTAASVSVTGLPVWINPTAALGTVVTVLSTVNVAIVAGAGGGGSVTTTAPGITATGQVMWVVGGQSTTVSPVFVSVPTVQSILTIVTVLGTQIVSVVPGVSVTIQQGATVTIQSALSTIVTILGTQIVSVVPGLSVSAVVSGTVTVNAGVSVTIQQGASITGTVSGLQVANQPVVIMISSTIVGSSTTMLMTIYTGATFVTTGASFYVVPAGKTFRIMAMQMIAVSSAVLGNARLCVLAATAAVSLSVTATVGIPAALAYAIQASTTPFAMGAYAADVAAGTTVGVGVQGGTSHSIVGGVIAGYLF